MHVIVIHELTKYKIELKIGSNLLLIFVYQIFTNSFIRGNKVTNKNNNTYII